MKKNKNNDVLGILQRFQKIINNKPSTREMFEEVRMMKFQVRPIEGDISHLNLADSRLIETLWNLGKLDEFFYKEAKKIPPKKRSLLHKIFKDISHKFQEELNGLNLKHELIVPKSAKFEMEIIKETSIPKKLN